MERLRLDIGPSPFYCILCTLVHLLAALALVVADLAWYLIASFTLALMVSLVFYIRRDGLRLHSDSVTGLEWRDGRWRLRLGDGQWYPVRLVGDFVLIRFLVVMNFSDPSRRHVVALLPDATGAADFRRLKMRLRLQPVSDVDNAGQGL